MADFETTTKLDENGAVRVWAWALQEIGRPETYQYGTEMNEFMALMEGLNGDVYFHNLKFDGSFIVNWLLHRGWEKVGKAKEKGHFESIVSKMGQWYAVDICYGRKKKQKIHTRFMDSLKKLPFAVKRLSKAFGIEEVKGEIDYHKERPVGYQLDENEKEYLRNDVNIVAQVLDIQFNEGFTRMTTSSDSLNEFKEIFGKTEFERYFPKLDYKLDKNLRYAYKGGFTWVKDEHASKVLGEGIVYDVNSLYPSIMYNKELPHGMPLPYDGEYVHDEEYPLYIQHIRCSFFVRDNHIPTIQIKGNPLFKSTEYLKSSETEIVDLYVTNVDLDLIKKHYYLRDVEYVQGWKFKKASGLFKKFIDKFMKQKVENTGAKKELAKLILNALYGKFASNPDKTGKDPYLRDDGSLGFKEGEEDIGDPVYTPMGAFITAWARKTTIDAAQECYDRVIYCDTDSLHLLGTEEPSNIPIHKSDLGCWKKEYTFVKAKYLRAKTYIDVKLNSEGKEEMVIRACGMTDDVKKHVTFDNFKIGFTAPGKKQPKQVKGGVIIEERYFTIH